MLGILQDDIVTPFLSLQEVRLKRQTKDPKEPPGQDLLKLLLQCRFRKASDPRDKIYSLLGLVAGANSNPLVAPTPTHLPLEIRPDYSSPVGAVYTHVAQQMIIASNTLDVLGGCESSRVTPATTPGPDVPSWVPDWSAAQTASPLLHDALGQHRTTHATSHSKALVQFINSGSITLIIHAHEVATFTALAPPLMKPIYNTAEATDKQCKEIDGLGAIYSEDGELLKFTGNVLGTLWKGEVEMFKLFMDIVPFLGTFSEWETFATAVPSTNPRGPGVTKSESSSDPSPNNATTALDIPSSRDDEEPEDHLTLYWQTLCTGTYDNTEAGISERCRKIATQKMFYGWRASLKPIYDLHRWKADRKLRVIGLVSYIVKTYREFSEFARFLDCCYGRRLGRAANGYLCLAPEDAKVGDKVILAKGGRVPLVVRQDSGDSGYWRFVGEAYVHGIMDGEVWEEDMYKEFKVR